MQTPAFLITAFLMGAILSTYLPMNSAASQYLGSSIAASFSFFVVALVTSLCILLFSGQQQCLVRIKTVPVYLHIAGIISAFFIVGTTFLVPRIGARTFFILLVSGQILMAIAISHFGLLESPQDPVTMKKVAGAILVIAGAVLSFT
jgi:transporter family-2 protein